MLEWLSANIGTIIVLAILIVIVALIVSRLVKNKKQGKHLCEYANGASCGGSCAHCGGGCAHAAASRRKK